TAAAAAEPPRSLSGDLLRAQKARDAILEIDLPAARDVLKGVDPADAALAVERARLGIFEGDYDGAAGLLGRSDLASSEEGAQLGPSATRRAPGHGGQGE